MTLSEELIYRGFHAETTIKNPKSLDEHPRNFYLGADPSADSLTIGNLAALMMCRVFVKHGHHANLLVGGATGQIGDPKDTVERDLKSLDEIAINKAKIAAQMSSIVGSDVPVYDNLDWFKDMKYLDFLRTIGKSFSMTQLMDRQFIQSRMGEGGSGISYAEFSYTLIQGYDFYHLYKEHNIDLQLCGADQYGNCASGLHLIRTLLQGSADIWSTPLVIDPVTGRKFGKSEGNAVWLDENKTSVFDYYQFWLGQPDTSVEYLLKIYTELSKDEIESLKQSQSEHPELRSAQKALAKDSTRIVHGLENAENVERLTEQLKSGDIDDALAEQYLPKIENREDLPGELARIGFAKSKSDARNLIKNNAIKIDDHILRRGKNKFAFIK